MSACPQCSLPQAGSDRFCPGCGFPVADLDHSSADPWVGRTLAGSYVILGVVGEGGMGTVYRAEQRTLHRTVAVKMIRQQRASDPFVSARLLNEARAISRINHPNVVSVIDFGMTPDGVPFIVMEYLRGRGLDRVVREDGILPPRRAVAIVGQVLAALGEAHALGLIHRDLKPANIMLDRLRSGRDFAKVLDFGLARMLDGSDTEPRRLSARGMVIGSPAYMSPEQVCGAEVDARSDLYAVGGILYELLTGRTPFASDDPAKVLVSRLTRDPVPVQEAANRTLPALLAQVTMRALARHPKNRFQSADDFIAALTEVEAEASAKDERLTMPASAPARECRTCGATVPNGKRFCGECGTSVCSSQPAGGEVPSLTNEWRGLAAAVGDRTRRTEASLDRMSAIEDDAGWLQTLWAGHADGMLLAVLAGEAGSGRTTALRKLLRAARGAGDVALEVSPGSTGVRCSGHCLEQLVGSLMRVGDAAGDPTALSRAPAAVRSFVEDYVSGRGDVRLPRADEYAAGAVASLAWALKYGARGAVTGRVVVGFDNFDRMDGATRVAVEEVARGQCDCPVMLVATQEVSWAHGWTGGVSRVARGIPVEQAIQALRAAGVDPLRALSGWRSPTITPLHLDQVIRSVREGGEAASTKTADLITARIGALGSDARALLQVMAVLGEDSLMEDLQTLLPDPCDLERALMPLTAAGMVDRSARGLCATHPMILEVAEAIMPAAVRREMYARACDLVEERSIPIEVRAWMTFHAERNLEAMFLLEQVADRAAARGDDEASIEALRLALDAARLDCRADAERRPSEAVLVFGRKLGDALLRAGRLVEADSLLRELIDLVGPDSPDGMLIMRGLARVARAESQSGEGHVVQAGASGGRQAVATRTR